MPDLPMDIPGLIHQPQSLQEIAEALAKAGTAPLGICNPCCVEFKQAEAAGFQPKGEVPRVYPAVTQVASMQQLSVPGAPGPMVGMVPIGVCSRHIVIQKGPGSGLIAARGTLPNGHPG